MPAGSPQHVVFVAPFFRETTLRFVDAAASLSGARVSLVSQDPARLLPPGLRKKLRAHFQVRDGMDAGQIAGAARKLQAQEGRIHRLFGSLEHLQVPLALVRQVLGIEGLSVEAARNFRDKARMKTVLEKAGLPCARHRLVASKAGAVDFAAQVGFPLVVKPPAGAGATGTWRVNDEGELSRLMDAVAPTRERPVLLEEFMTGREHSFDCISIGGEAVWHSLTHYLPRPLEVIENPWIQWCVLLPRELDHTRYDDIRRQGTRALTALGMHTGLSHMEWFRRDDGSIAISEVGARPPGAQICTLMSYAHDLNFYRAWTELMIFDRFEPPEQKFAAGVAFFRGQGRGRIKAVHGLEQAQKEIGELVVEVQLPKVGQAPSTSYEGDGFAVLRHPRTEVVEQALRRLVSLIRVELG